MNIFDFLTNDEIDDLPEDPDLAFTTFVHYAQRRLAERAAQLEEQEQWRSLDEARHGFMNVTIAAAKRFKIEPFASLEVPRLDNFDYQSHAQFKADLDHYMTQLLLNNSIRGKYDSVPMLPKAKDRIRSHIHALKTCVDNSDLTNAKKAALLKKLAAFEAELDKQRLSFMAVARVTIEILAIPGAMWASADIATKLVTNILHEVGEAKAADDEIRQIPVAPPPAVLSAPRRELKPDDDIPF